MDMLQNDSLGNYLIWWNIQFETSSNGKSLSQNTYHSFVQGLINELHCLPVVK